MLSSLFAENDYRVSREGHILFPCHPFPINTERERLLPHTCLHTHTQCTSHTRCCFAQEANSLSVLSIVVCALLPGDMFTWQATLVASAGRAVQRECVLLDQSFSFRLAIQAAGMQRHDKDLPL